MPTLILSARNNEDSQRLWRAAIRKGWAVERLHDWRVPEEMKSVPEPILYAEALLAPIHATHFGLSLLEPPNEWLPRLPQAYRQRKVILTTLEQARLGEFPSFVKPPNDKSFPPTVCQCPDDLPKEYAEDAPVLVAEVVRWEKEFRCFVLDRELRTFSVYLRNGKLQRDNEFESSAIEDAEVSSFVGALLADPRVELPRAIVIDVGMIEGRGWAVVELNAAWGSGTYGCDPDVVLDVLRFSAVPAIKNASD
ncbi:MAG: ATP-grasp domain-containing protein [Planctomycetaceae bacterium]|nr:ATP-grasp domain-containing protein [Planctomycetaceae bacterium]